ncbi:MAG: aminotransferase class I/II-fold pyridoxal phosphate-dependent enzyme, partial [Alphaproteobacteria bacterium]|nr:aminotransferase class I/II-fold pyridoxal phosphate-dependent enzyme [Alphaproteobacteria bacterium]
MSEGILQPDQPPELTGDSPDLFSKFDDLIAMRQGLLDTGIEDPFNLVMEKVLSPTRAICNGRETILLGTYNYMGMTFDPDVIEAGKQALADFGAGTTGSRVLNGTYQGHRECEDALREFYAMDHAMVFSTGYQANLGIISTIAGKGDYVILDIDSHASIWDGCAMGNAEVVPFKHNDVEALEKRLKRIPAGAGKLVVLEGVYSMLGDVAPLKEMVRICKENGAMVLVDEAHSMGFIGEHGRGVCEDQGIIDDVDFIIGTFSKSVGTVGGFCVSNHPKFEIMRLVCRPYVFTASLPPSVVATAATSIRKLMHGSNKRAHLWENSRNLHAGLRELGFSLGTPEAQSAIIAVIMPDLEKGATMWEALLKEGLYVNLARPPATPANMTLLRCSLCAEHSEQEVATILTMFE